jgi:hypothetical protein
MYNDPEERHHKCIQETSIALMKSHIAASNRAWNRIEEKLNNGLITQVALNSSSLKSAWWFIGIIIVVFIGSIVTTIYSK